MLKNLSKNKRIFLLIVMIVIILCLVVGILFSCSSDKSNKSDTNAESEQGEIVIEEDDGKGLEVKEEIDQKAEDSTSASGSWETSSQEDNKTEDVGIHDGTAGSDEQNAVTTDDQKDEAQETKEDIPTDEKTWGEVF